eukprot:4258429-Amphidinium_carterae.1
MSGDSTKYSRASNTVSCSLECRCFAYNDRATCMLPITTRERLQWKERPRHEHTGSIRFSEPIASSS